MCDAEEQAYVKDIHKLTGKKITVVEENPFPLTDNPMNDKEKKEFEKDKQRVKQEFFANRKKKEQEQAASKSAKSKKSFKRKKPNKPKPRS